MPIPSLSSFAGPAQWTGRRDISRSALIFCGALLLLMLGLWMVINSHFSLTASILFLGLFLFISMKDKRLGMYCVIVYLFLLGDIRRIVGMTGDYPALDPLLLVGPIYSIVMALPILMKLRFGDPLSKAVVALMAVMTLEIVNPKQGPVVVGLAGAMYYLVPMLWYWLGRQVGDFSMLDRVIRFGLVPLGTLAAVLAVVQTYIGFLPWEQAWINNVASHLTSLNLGGGFIRAIGFSVNGIEFTQIMCAGCTAALALFFAKRRGYILLVPIMVWGIFLSSSRGAVLRCLFGVAAAWAVRGRSGRGFALRLVLALSLGIAAIGFSATRAAQSEGNTSGQFTSAADASSQHQIQGLAHPLDAKHSTAGLHSEMVLQGILKGVTYPIGYGLGSATLGSGKLGGDVSASGSSEFDISDVFTTTGLIGGLIYTWMLFLIFRRLILFGRLAPHLVGLAVAGMIFAFFGEWLQLGSYAMTPTIWFLIGSVSRLSPPAKPNPLHIQETTAVAVVKG